MLNEAVLIKSCFTKVNFYRTYPKNQEEIRTGWGKGFERVDGLSSGQSVGGVEM